MTNSSSHTIPIDKIVTSCGCTTTSSLTNIPAHTTVPLNITFNSAFKIGEQHKAIWVFDSGKSEPSVQVDLTGNVNVVLETKPQSFYAGSVSPGQYITKSVIVHRVDGFELTSLTMLNKNVTKPKISRIDPFQIRCTFTCLPDTQSDTDRFDAIFSTDSATIPPITVPIYYDLVSDFQVTPHEVNLGVVSQSKPGVARLSIVGTGAGEIQVLAKPPWIEISKTTVGDNLIHFNIIADVNHLEHGNYTSAQVVLRTQDRKQPKIVIPVYIVDSVKES